jgi:ankyrin repeat protein
MQNEVIKYFLMNRYQKIQEGGGTDQEVSRTQNLWWRPFRARTASLTGTAIRRGGDKSEAAAPVQRASTLQLMQHNIFVQLKEARTSDQALEALNMIEKELWTVIVDKRIINNEQKLDCIFRCFDRKVWTDDVLEKYRTIIGRAKEKLEQTKEILEQTKQNFKMSSNDAGRYLLFEAIKNGNKNDVSALLAMDVPAVSFVTSKKRTPIHLASLNGYDNIAAQLIHAWDGNSIDIDSQDQEGKTPLHLASWNKHDNIVAQLIQAGASIDIHDQKGWTALHCVSHIGHLESVKRIVVQHILTGVSIDLQDKEGWTALHRACLMGHDPIVKQLIWAGATVDFQEGEGRTPLHLASWNGYKNTVELLIQKGANIDHQDAYGWTPLMLAAFSSQDRRNTMRLLLEYGANKNITATDVYGNVPIGKTVIDIAKELDDTFWLQMH